MLLGALFRDIGTADVPLLTMSAPRQAYISRDLHDWAEYWEVPFAFAPQFPVRSVTAQRVTIVDPDTIPALYEATWACLLYTSPSPRDATLSRMPSSA